MSDPAANMPPALLASIQHQKENLGDDRRVKVLVVTWILWLLAVVAIGFRFYAESLVRNRFKLHDLLIVLGLIFTLGLCIDTTVGTKYGTGRHFILADESDVVNILKLLFAFELMYTFANVAIKASILMFYYRTFPHNRFKIAVWCVAALVGAWFITMIFLTVFQCTPISFVWNKTLAGTCINVSASYMSTAIVNVITDFIIVVMPVPLILRLNMPNGRKLGVCAIFILGSIVIVASIVRPVTLQNFDIYDITYEGTEVGIWALVEPCLGIVGACLPLMAPLFRRIKEMTTANLSKANGGSHVSTWTHSRLREGKSTVSQQHWRKETMPAYVTSDDAPLTSHTESEGRDSENDSTTQVKRDIEMQGLPKAFRP